MLLAGWLLARPPTMYAAGRQALLTIPLFSPILWLYSFFSLFFFFFFLGGYGPKQTISEQKGSQLSMSLCSSGLPLPSNDIILSMAVDHKLPPVKAGR
jgi:hypothetical protein